MPVRQERIAAIAVPALLAVDDWPPNADRYQRLVRLVEYLFERFDRLRNEAGRGITKHERT